MEIEIDKESNFTLEMKIDGDVVSKEPPQMRFSIVGESFTYSVDAKRVENGIYEINIPKLKGVFESGEYDANVEIFIDGKHFIPLKEKVKLKQEIKPTVTIASSASVKESVVEPSVRVSIGEPKKTTTVTKTEEVIRI